MTKTDPYDPVDVGSTPRPTKTRQSAKSAAVRHPDENKPKDLFTPAGDTTPVPFSGWNKGE